MKSRLNLVKKLTVGVFAIGILVAGIAITPKQAEAEDTITIKNTVIYDESYSIVDYWNNEKKAPVKDGYVFGGWFKEDSNATADNRETLTSEDGITTKVCVPLTAKNIDANDDNMVDEGVTAIAKFVPAQVLSVKAQNGVPQGGKKIESASDISEENPMWVRVMTGQDSQNYSAIGFDIRLANKKAPINSANGTEILETDKVFDKVYVGDTLTDAEVIFGQNSHYVCVWKLDKIDTSSNANKIIYVRPYWYTTDGTKVNGIAKYIHIEDEYKGYINVPVNITRKKDVAAGAINMTYAEGLEFAKDDGGNILFEAGRIFPDMEFNVNEYSRSISMIGNEVNVGTYANTDETIYANIRFKKPTMEATLNFDMELVEFCGWDEYILSNNTDVKVWDISYENKETTE